MSDSPFPRQSFATTRWSLVRATREEFGNESREALASLCESYWYPLYVFVRRRGYQAAEAQDITQAFIAELLERESIQRADPERGRFRSFLLGGLNRFLAEHHRHKQAQKRGGGRKLLSIDWTDAESRYRLEPSDDVTPEHVFDRQWALTVLECVVDQLRSKYESEGKSKLFEKLEGTLTGNSDKVAYADIAASLKMKEGAIKVAVHRMRKRYRELLRTEIAQTVNTSEDLEEELRHLFQALRSS